MTLNDKLKAIATKARELGLQADFWNPICLIISPKPDPAKSDEELAIEVKAEAEQPLTPASTP